MPYKCGWYPRLLLSCSPEEVIRANTQHSQVEKAGATHPNLEGNRLGEANLISLPPYRTLGHCIHSAESHLNSTISGCRWVKAPCTKKPATAYHEEDWPEPFFLSSLSSYVCAGGAVKEHPSGMAMLRDRFSTILRNV